MTLHDLSGVAMNDLWRASWQGAILIGCVLLIRQTFGDRLPASWRCVLWLLVAARLALPVLPASPWSIFNWISPQTDDTPIPVADVTIRVAPTTNLPVAHQRSLHRLDRAVILALLWIAGATGLALTIASANLNFRRRVRQTATKPSEEIVACWASCGEQLGLREIPKVLCTSEVSNPALFGVWRGQLLLPADFGRGLSAGEQHMILMHELAHYGRRDLVVSWIMAVLRVFHWFNPMVWLATAAWRADAEAACDRIVIDAFDARGRIDYGLTLLKLATGTQPNAPMPALGILGGERQLRRRIGAIIRTGRQWRLTAVILVVLVALFGLTDARNAARADAAATQPAASIMVSTRIVSVDASKLADLGLGLAANGAIQLKDADMEKLAKTAGPDDVVSSPKVIAWSGQHAVITIGSEYSYISDFNVSTAPDGSRSYTPKLSQVMDGMELSVTPTIGADQLILMQLKLKFTKLEGMKDIPWRQNPAMTIQMPTVDVRSTDTRLSLADGMSAVISGIDADKKATLLFVTPKIVKSAAK
jgi:beta-lactamase regulating signal transducer with metallopeptidase domain